MGRWQAMEQAVDMPLQRCHQRRMGARDKAKAGGRRRAVRRKSISLHGHLRERLSIGSRQLSLVTMFPITAQ